MVVFSLFWILLVGGITGVLTQFVIPRKGWGQVWVTVLLGVGGSLLGEFVGRALGFHGFVIPSFLGALILLVPYVLRKRAAARGSEGESMRADTLSTSPRTSRPA